jgi:hypothetical protein
LPNVISSDVRSNGHEPRDHARRGHKINLIEFIVAVRYRGVRPLANEAVSFQKLRIVEPLPLLPDATPLAGLAKWTRIIGDRNGEEMLGEFFGCAFVHGVGKGVNSQVHVVLGDGQSRQLAMARLCDVRAPESHGKTQIAGARGAAG